MPRPIPNEIWQSLGLHLVNINAYAKFYQNIPNGLRVINIFHEQAGVKIFTNMPASKSSQTVRWQNQMFDYRALLEIQLSVDYLRVVQSGGLRFWKWLYYWEIIGRTAGFLEITKTSKTNAADMRYTCRTILEFEKILHINSPLYVPDTYPNVYVWWRVKKSENKKFLASWASNYFCSMFQLKHGYVISCIAPSNGEKHNILIHKT